MMPHLKPIWKRSMILFLNGVNTFYFYSIFSDVSTSTITPSTIIIPSMGIGINSLFLYSILGGDSGDVRK